jgi:hypothetical protein
MALPKLTPGVEQKSPTLIPGQEKLALLDATKKSHPQAN